MDSKNSKSVPIKLNKIHIFQGGFHDLLRIIANGGDFDRRRFLGDYYNPPNQVEGS